MKKKFLPHEVVEPSWFREVSPNSTLTIKDLTQLFGVSESLIHQMYEVGKLPKPDMERGYLFDMPNTKMMGLYVRKSNKIQWRIKTIRDFLKQAREGAQS